MNEKLIGKLTKPLCVLVFTIVLVSAWAYETGISTVTTYSTTKLATVIGLSPEFSKAPIKGAVMRTTNLDIFEVNDIDPYFINRIKIRITLVNPDQLTPEYDFMMFHIEIYDFTGGSVGGKLSTKKILSLENPIIEFYTEDWISYSRDLIVKTDVVFKSSKAGISVKPELYLEISQA